MGFPYTSGETVASLNTWETISIEWKLYLFSNPTIPLLNVHTRETLVLVYQEDMCKNVDSIVCNRRRKRKLETTQMPFNFITESRLKYVYSMEHRTTVRTKGTQTSSNDR